MSNPEPTIRVNVDVTNPGQFFACCGLLELADRLWPGANVLGAFEPKHFCLWLDSSECSLKYMIERFVKSEVQQLDVNDDAASPLHLASPFDLRLDWWQKIDSNKKRVNLGGGEQLMTWSGKQLGPLIFRLMKNACTYIDLLKLFDDPRAVYDTKNGKAKKKATSPFYFDARRCGTSLDIGFSPDEQEMSVMAYPAVESLALVGLQRFRPRADENGQGRSFLYTAWADPLPPVVAMAAVSLIVPVRSCGTFRFTKPSRGGDYLTMFSYATPERSNYV